MLHVGVGAPYLLLQYIARLGAPCLLNCTLFA